MKSAQGNSESTDLAFEPEAHLYRWRGHDVPSVTQLLGGLYTFASVPEDVLEAARQRGTFVHRMCELSDLNDLDESDPALEPYRGYLDAWRDFMRTYEPNWDGIEERLYSGRHHFAGQLDRRGTMGRIHPGRRGLFDIKTAAQSHWCWGVQTAAYRQLVIERDPQWALADRFTVQLNARGGFFVLPWRNPNDWATFSALLHLHQRSKEST